MKKTIVRIILVTFLLLASGTAPVLADSTPMPVCYPQTLSHPSKVVAREGLGLIWPLSLNETI